MKIAAIIFTALFVALKLTGYIDWSWLLVLSPLIGYVVIILLLSGGYAYVKFKELSKPNPLPGKSKWAQRVEEMQKIQAERNKSTPNK